jgi:hypothetical protein
MAGRIAAAVVTAALGVLLAVPNNTEFSSQMVITAQTSQKGVAPASLEAGQLTVLTGKTPARVLRLDPLTGDMANMQLFIFLDDSSRSNSLGPQLGELKSFVESLPATTQVAVGYMRNGGFSLAQGFTPDHSKAAHALGLPMGLPGENGSPYFALSDLAKHWPSKEATNRRAVLMLTDGVDRYWGTAVMDDPFVDESIHDVLRAGVTVYSIYLRGAGRYGEGDWVTNMGQSRLQQVSRATGGEFWSEGFGNPVAISPFLKDFSGRLGHQYRVTVEALNRQGVVPVKVQSELPGVKIQSPAEIYVP